MIVRELVALLGVQSDTASFNKAEGGMTKLIGAAKAAAAAFAAFKVVQWARGAAIEVANLGDKFDKMSKRIAISTEELQQLDFVSSLAGSSIEQVEDAFIRLQRSMWEADQGSTRFVESFKQLGIEIKKEDGSMKTLSEILPDMADGFKDMESSTDKTALAMNLLGRSGTKLIPMLEQGSEAIREQMTELIDLGAIMDDKLIGLSTEFVDNQLRLDKALLGVKNTIARELLPVFIDMQEYVLAWWKANRKWIALRIAPIFKGVGRVVLSNVKFFADLVKRVVEFVGNLSPLQKKILGVSAIIGVLGAAIKAGPIGKLLALASIIGLVIDDFRVWQAGGKSVTGRIVKYFNDVLGIDLVTWVSAGIEAFKAMAMAVKGHIERLSETVAAFVIFFTEVWENPKKAFIDLWDAIKKIWGESVKYLQDTFEEFVVSPIMDGLGSLWEGFKTWFADVLSAAKTWAGEILTAITSPIKKILGPLAKVFGFTGGGAAKKLGPVAEGAKQLANVGGGAGIPNTVSPKAGSGITNNTSTDINIKVTGVPDGQGKKVGEDIKKVLKPMIKQELAERDRATMRALRSTAQVGV